MTSKPNISKERRAQLLANGWRSGLEEATASFLTDRGVFFEYETRKITYEVHKTRTYTPDFLLPGGLIIETKGRWTTEDRQKMKMIKEQHPGLDIRILFSNPHNRISKTSKTTYAMYADKLGIPWAKGPEVPDEWLTQTSKA